MRLKIFRVLLTIFVLLPLVHPFETVYALSLNDLSDFGVLPMIAARGNAAVLDGRISDGEYGEASIYSEEKGLYFLSGENVQKANPSSGASQENFVLLSGDAVFCALQINIPSGARSVFPVVYDGVLCYRVSFSIGLADGEHPVCKGSLLSNTYYFSAEDAFCVGFTGERVARSVNEPSSASKPLSTFSASYRENGIVSADGSKWNAEYYCKNACFSLQESSAGTVLTAEVKIPLEDALRSVLPAERESVRSALSLASERLCGSFSTRVELDANSSVVTGVPSGLSLPNSASGQTLSEWMKNDFETPLSGVYVPKLIPLPLYWSGSVPESSVESSVQSQETDPSSAPLTTAGSTDGTVAVQTTVSPVTTVAANDGIPEGAEVIPENDESIFDSLPDADEILPEDTEILYDEISSEDKQSEDDSLVSSILTTLTGALLFATVLVLCIYFRDAGKENNTKKEERDPSKKKNEPKKKDGKKKEGRRK